MASIVVMVLGISIALSCGGLALAQGHVLAEVGSDVLLPCHFNKPVRDDEMVSWEREAANGSHLQILSFDKKPTPRLPNIEWAGDLSRSNASVKILAVRIEDAGHYSCATFYSEFSLSITLSVVSEVVEAPSKKNNNNNGDTTIIVAVMALLVIIVFVVGVVLAKKMRGRRRRNRDNESGTPPSTELQVLASAASTA